MHAPIARKHFSKVNHVHNGYDITAQEIASGQKAKEVVEGFLLTALLKHEADG